MITECKTNSLTVHCMLDCGAVRAALDAPVMSSKFGPDTDTFLILIWSSRNLEQPCLLVWCIWSTDGHKLGNISCVENTNLPCHQLTQSSAHPAAPYPQSASVCQRTSVSHALRDHLCRMSNRACLYLFCGPSASVNPLHYIAKSEGLLTMIRRFLPHLFCLLSLYRPDLLSSVTTNVLHFLFQARYHAKYSNENNIMLVSCVTIT